MISPVAEILGLGIGMLASPGLFAMTVFLLSKKENKISGVLSFLAGNILTVAILIVAGFLLGTAVSSGPASALRNEIDIVIGLVFIFFGVKTLLSKKETIKKLNSAKLSFWFVIGFIFSITNFDAETLFIVSMKQIIQLTATVSEEIALITYSTLMILLPILVPLGFYMIFPKTSEKILTKINKPVQKYGYYFVIFIFLLFGALFVLKGLGYA